MRTRGALVTLGMCCINESIASEWIRSCWRVATSPLAIAANKHHLQANVAEWKKRDPFLPEAGVPAHGHLSASDTNDVIDAAIADLVRPGLALVDLSSTRSDDRSPDLPG